MPRKTGFDVDFNQDNGTLTTEQVLERILETLGEE